jgi:tetratricopeptide (TPR) repeat protein
VLFLLGAAAAPALADGEWRIGDPRRWVVAGAVGLALLLAVPLFLSERYANRAYDEYPSDTPAALSDLNRASDLDPYATQPLYAKGVIEQRAGGDAAAAASFRDAIEREPVNYAGHYFLAASLEKSDPSTARAEVSEAMRLNPFDLKSRALARRLGLKPKKIQVG